MSLGVFFDRQTDKEVQLKYPQEEGVWQFDEDDFLLYAMLADPVLCAELIGEDPGNRDYAGQYVVRDYQYPLFRAEDNFCGFACARYTGKTQSIIWRAVSHAFRRMKQNLLVTAPELIHLLPLTDAIEERILSTRLTREMLATDRQGKTGLTHRPFGVDYADGTKIVGRIPQRDGRGVKAQHEPDLIIEEAQNYPEAGWNEVHETVMKDVVDIDGNPDFHYHFYGVHSGDRGGGFHARTTQGGFRVINVTALQRYGWSKAEKDSAKAAYGGTQSPDYRRNILGEAGAASSPYFVTARLFATVDQDRESNYNQHGYRYQRVTVEEFDELMLPIAEMLDLPSGLKEVWGGMDLGLTTAPTMIVLFSRERVDGKMRLKLVRRIRLERMRPKTLRAAVYAIVNHFGRALKGFGIDETGLGFPIWQEMEDDEHAPPTLTQVCKGFFFNAKVPVHVDKVHLTQDVAGSYRDQYGSMVEEVHDPLTGMTQYVTRMPMIEASTRFLRELVDPTILMLPFDPEVTGDMQGETQQRVKRIAGLKNKPNAFHILDAMRAMAMMLRRDEIDAAMAVPVQQVVKEVTF